MTYQIQFVNLKNDPRLETAVAERLLKLEKKYAWIISARVFLKVENFPAGKNKLCEVDLSVPGPDIFTKENGETFEAAIAGAFNELEILLRKHKSKFQTR